MSLVSMLLLLIVFYVHDFPAFSIIPTKGRSLRLNRINSPVEASRSTDKDCPREKFLSEFRVAIIEKTLVKLSLSGARTNQGDDNSMVGLEEEVRSGTKGAVFRLVELRTGICVQAVFRHPTNVITKNYDMEEALSVVTTCLIGGPVQFRTATLETSNNRVILQ